MDEGSDQTADSDDYDDDDDGYDEANSTDDGDCESTFYYGPRGHTGGRLCRRNVATRGGGSGGGGGNSDNSSFRIRSKWKKYHYQAVPRAMTIQEEDEEIAGPSTTTTMTTATAVTPTSSSATRGAAATSFSLEYLPHNSMANPNRTIQIPNIHVTMANERNRHVIIHVNDVELGHDEHDDCDGGFGGGGDGDEDDGDDNDDDEDIYDVRTHKSISENESLLVAYDSNSVSSV